jgi:hypothetical protein
MGTYFLDKSKLFIVAYFGLLFSVSCIDPVPPEFQFIDELIIIEGFASSTPGASSVIINRTSSEFGIYRNLFQEGAQVTFENIDSGEVVNLKEQIAVYVPPIDFVVTPGTTWQLNLVLSDGTRYKSFPEKVIAPVPISDISATFDKELLFREDSRKFVPGHSIAVSFDEPGEDKNYYLWRFRSFENIILCRVCDNGVFRNGECQRNPAPGPGIPARAAYYTYGCETACWTIRSNESIEILDDEFINGSLVNRFPTAKVPLYTNEDILVSLEQVSLSVDAHQYYKRLKDIVDNNGNFDTPPPAAVIGNLFNPNNGNEIVLGRFTAASNSNASIFIKRTDILEDEIDPPPQFSFETTPPIPLLEIISSAPCIESRFRTGVEPEGWIDN